MKITWVQKNNVESCIIFFCGWGMDEHSIQHLLNNKFDVVMINDYDVTKPCDIDVVSYKYIYIIAWSMGVWAANTILPKTNIQFTYSVAINGTGTPVHENDGIPEPVFKGTLDGWNDASRKKFTMRMFGGGREFLNAQEYVSRRSSENQKQELQRIYNENRTSEGESGITWNKAIIGERDYIFTAENQKNYWLARVNSIILPIPHFPFMYFTKWEDILSV